MKNVMLSFLLLGAIGSQTSIIQASPAEQTTKKINLYVYRGCPYCNTVVQYLKKNGWFKYVTIVNADNAKNYAELQRLSKSTQCPFLNDEVHGVNMLESKQIMAYFHKTFTA